MLPARDDRGAERHVASLDGVRGLAIALVIVRHLSLVPALHGSGNAFDRALDGVLGAGWIGVDLFFVLSGFLITGILLRERDRDASTGAKLGRFYWRRILRIAPLYYAACAILFYVVPSLPYFREQAQIATLHQSAPWYWLYGVNFLEVVHPHAAPFNTGHFWSLSVEEQFYLVWPFIILGASRKNLVRIIAGLIILAPLVRLGLIAWLPAPSGENAAYTLSIARVDVLGVGAMIALLNHGEAARWLRARSHAQWIFAGAFATFAAIALASGANESRSPLMQTLGYSAVACAMGCVIILALGGGSEESRVQRAFSAPALRTLGKYSYCLYVVHYPLMVVIDLVWMRVRIPTLLGSSVPSWLAYSAVLIGISLSIAWVSWRVFEAPILRLKDRFTWHTTPLTAKSLELGTHS